MDPNRVISLALARFFGTRESMILTRVKSLIW
jgi:hypothetical protein